MHTKRQFDSLSPSSKRLSSSYSREVLFCGHSSWQASYEMTTVPHNTRLYIYAPLGAALSKEVVRAIAAGEKIKPGDLQCRRISPITLFNFGYEDTGEDVGNYVPKILLDYPCSLEAEEEIPNYHMSSPKKDALSSDNLEVVNIGESQRVSLEDLLQEYQGRTCHFGGCSWVKSDFSKRNIVEFANPILAQRHKDPILTDEEKLQLRKARFG